MSTHTLMEIAGLMEKGEVVAIVLRTPQRRYDLVPLAEQSVDFCVCVSNAALALGADLIEMSIQELKTLREETTELREKAART